MGRGSSAVRAADHDMNPSAVLTPAGILEVAQGQLHLIFGTSRDTSDFMADVLEVWWTNRHAAHPRVRRLLINLDNGPEINSSRTQFMKRMVEFSDRHQLVLELAYYPPYHSKYNPIERCWGILENHWNATLLTSIDTALEWAKTMTWRGTHRVCVGRHLQQGRPCFVSRISPLRFPLGTIDHPFQVEPGHSSTAQVTTSRAKAVRPTTMTAGAARRRAHARRRKERRREKLDESYRRSTFTGSDPTFHAFFLS